MLKFLLRVVSFIVGLVLLAEVGLPTSSQSLQVDQHTSTVSHRSSNGINSRWADTSYTLHFVGGRLSSCSVGYSAYGKLKDGDTVEVQATKLFKTCIRITRGDEVVEADNHWKLFEIIGGLLLLAVAIGWINTENDDGVRFW